MFSKQLGVVYATILTALLSCTQVHASYQNGINGENGVRTNGNVAFTLSKDYIESHQGLFKKLMIKEMEEMELRDVRVQQKTDLGRLTSLMSKVRLSEIDLESAHMSIDFVGKQPASSEVQCETDFEMYVRITGLSMVFEFDQWFEVQSNSVVEEWGLGTFLLPNMTFSIALEPYVNQEKFRLKIKDRQLNIDHYEYRLNTNENSKFEQTLNKFSTVFAEHMRNQVNVDLSDRLAVSLQKGAHQLFRRVQQNNKVYGREIFMNKHLINLCYHQGAPISKDPHGKVVKREPGAVSFEIDGTFHRSQDVLNTNTNSDMSFSGLHHTKSGTKSLVMGKVAFDSLLEATFKESGKVEISKSPIMMSVEDLEDMAEGFTNVFDESSDVKISAHIDKIFAIQFDSDFANIPLRSEWTINFSNPIDERFLAAQAKVAFKGTCELSIIDDYKFKFILYQEKVKVQQFTPYFLSETTLAEFEEEYLNVLQDKILVALNKKFSSGIPLPLGADLGLMSGPLKLTIFNDYFLAESTKRTVDDDSADHRFTSLDHYKAYSPEKEAERLSNYPDTWVVDQSHNVTHLGASEEVISSNASTASTAQSADETCKGKNCANRTDSSKRKGRSDEL